VESEQTARLGDYTVTPRVLIISLIAVGIGVASSYVAWALLKLIALATNIFFFLRFNTENVSPANHHLGWLVVLVPVVGGFLVGLMARYGSERIRGHGMPEAIESILLRGSKVDPKVALMKPVSAAVSIGSGGPFGAEGPIIMTGGAIGSLIAQFFHLTDTERKTLLVAGSAAGMTAIFATPIAAVILAFELLLFEFKPRSLIPVALASATAAAARVYLLGAGPLFAKEQHAILYTPRALLGCVILGILCAAMSLVLTKIVYAAEDAFERLPMHWMWWPLLGGLIIGVGGLLFPRGLGVGYDLIGDLLQDNVTVGVIVGILLVKSLMWALSLGSGTSGGVVAPLLIVGGGVGAAAAHFLPGVFPFEGAGFWALLGMAAVLGSTIGAPIMCIIFAVELTQDMNMFLPLLLTVMIAHTVNVLLMPRSILTEKISRRGFHLSREYSVDPLEIMTTKEVMRTTVVALPATLSVDDLRASFATEHSRRGQWLYPIVREDQSIVGVLTRGELQRLITEREAGQMPINMLLADTCQADRKLVLAYPDEPLRVIVNRMAESGLTRFPVVDRRGKGREQSSKEQRGEHHVTPKLVGLVSLTDLLKARVANLQAERHRERILPIRLFLPKSFKLRA
jgi:chloride channel protein, CIC family